MADANSTAGAFTCARCGQTIYDKATHCAGQWYHWQCITTPPRLDRATLDNLLDELEAAAHGYGAGEGAYANVLEAHRAILHYCCPEATDGK